MQKTKSKPTDVSVPQSVTDFIKVKTEQETIKIGFTDQKISPHAGLSAFAGFLSWLGFKSFLGAVLPHRSKQAIPTEDVALGFIVGILSGAKKLAQLAYLRGDAVLGGLFRVEEFGSPSAYTRFFQCFKSAQNNSAHFAELWRWCLQRLSSKVGGYTLDLDSTTLLHEDAHGKQGVRTGYTPKGFRRCYHPILAVFAEVKLVVGFWLRPGNAGCANNVVAFTLELLRRLPSYIRVGLVRADSGFCQEDWLQLLEQRGLSYIVVGRIHRPVHRLIRQTTNWQKTPVEGIEVADGVFAAWGWVKERRILLIRHRVAQRPDAGGRLLLDCPGYKYQVLITNLALQSKPLEVWYRYNGRGDSENVIKELDASFALADLCLEGFYATEAALSLAVLSYNLSILFQRHLGWSDRVTAATLRFRLFTTGGTISRTGGYQTIRLSVRQGPIRDWWRRLLEKITAPFPNCVAVPQKPPPVPI